MDGVGDTLRDARLARGLSHEYVSAVIKIRPEFLRALEDGEIAVLPTAYHAQRFLRTYADYLGLDSGELITRFVTAESEEAAAVPEPEPEQRPVAVPQPMASDASVPVPAGRSPRATLLRLGGAGTGIVGIVAMALAARALLEAPPAPPSPGVVSRGAPTAVAPEATPSTVVERRATATSRPSATAPPRVVWAPPPGERVRWVAPEPTPTPTPRAPEGSSAPIRRPASSPIPMTPASPASARTPIPAPRATPTRFGDGIVARLRAEEEAFVRVRVDGRTVLSTTLDAGKSRFFRAERELFVFSSRAQDVVLSVNGCTRRRLAAYGCPECVRAYYRFTTGYTDCRQQATKEERIRWPHRAASTSSRATISRSSGTPWIRRAARSARAGTSRTARRPWSSRRTT